MVDLKAFTVPLFFTRLTILVTRVSLTETIHTGAGQIYQDIQSAVNSAQLGIESWLIVANTTRW